jgi:hypothetical protein
VATSNSKPVGVQAAVAYFDRLSSLEFRIGLAPEEGREPKEVLRERGTVHEVDGSINVATAAYRNEFGTVSSDEGPAIPARPAWRTTIRGQMLKKLAVQFAARLRRRSLARQLALQHLDADANWLGQQLAAALVTTITKWTTPPNAPRTIAAKGENDPLVATRQTTGSISAQVIMRRRRQRRVFADGSTK